MDIREWSQMSKRVVYQMMQTLFVFGLLTKSQITHITQPCVYHNKSLPIPLYAHQMVYFEHIDSVYIFGGVTANNQLSSAIFKWDRTVENSWFELLNGIEIPSPEFAAYTNMAVIIDNKAYFIGIFDALPDGNIYIFDPLIDSFLNTTNLSKAIYPTWEGCVASNETHIFMVGGYNDSHLQIYDINANVWQSEDINISPINTLVTYYLQFCEMIDDSLFVFGGFGDSWTGLIDINDYFMYESKMQTWTRLGSKGGSTSAGGTAYYNSDILIIGGFHMVHHKFSSNIQTFNVNNRQFGDVFNITEGVGYFPTLIIDDELYVFGGTNQAGDILSSIQVCGLSVSSLPISNRRHIYIIIFSVVMSLFILCAVIICIKRRKSNDRLLNDDPPESPLSNLIAK